MPRSINYGSPAINALRQLTGREHVFLTGRAAAGVYAVLVAAGVKNQIVLLPANICYIVLWAVLRSGNIPHLVDIDPQTGNLTPETLKNCGIENPGAIVVCHLYGLPAPMQTITAWAKARHALVIEDAALALGATVDGKPSGAWGDASVFSFGQGKIVDHDLGGALLTDDDALAAELKRVLARMPEWNEHHRLLTNQWHGLYWTLHQYETRSPDLLNLYPGLYKLYGELVEYRLPVDHWQRLTGKLTHLTENLTSRLRVASAYDALLLPHDLPLRTMPRPAGSILWRYPLIVLPEERDDLLFHLWEQGVHAATLWYPSLRYMMGALLPDLALPPTPGADTLSASIINLPLEAGIDEGDLQRTAQIIWSYFQS